MSMNETLLVNGNILTVDEGFAVAESMAVRGNMIVAVGDVDATRNALSEEATIIDLQGKTVLPGFIDLHAHIGYFGNEKLWVNLEGAASIPEVCNRIAERAAEVEPGTPIITTAIGEGPYFFHGSEVLAEKRYPSRRELDEAAPNNPVYITAPTNRVPNSAVFNTEALRLAGILEKETTTGLPNRLYITDDYIWLDGIKVMLGEDGSPTGELQNMHRMYNLSSYFDRITEWAGGSSYGEMKEGIRLAASDFSALGTTTLLENHLTRVDEARAYSELDLPLRMFYTYELEGSRSLDQISSLLDVIGFAAEGGISSERLGIIGVSVGLDGPHYHGTAYVGEPYIGPDGVLVNPGPLMPEEHYRAIMRMASERGFNIHAEAAGRASIELALSTLEDINKDIPIGDRRTLLVHCEFPTQEQIGRAKALGIVPTTTTNFLWGKGSDVYLERLGPDYSQNSIPFRWWLDEGVITCNESDWGPHSPLFTIWQSLAREAGLTGEKVGLHQAPTREEAIRMMTWNCAYALHRENEIGSLEPGKLADYVVLDVNPMSCEEDAIKNINVLTTVCDGVTVYGSLD
ncbi:MAG: amidohydrolase [Actinomycetota bacterium]